VVQFFKGIIKLSNKEKIVNKLLNTAIPLYKEYIEILNHHLKNNDFFKDEGEIVKMNNYINDSFQLLYIKPIDTIVTIIKKSIYNKKDKVYLTIKQRKIIDRWIHA
jgi:hypothetical protein